MRKWSGREKMKEKTYDAFVASEAPVNVHVHLLCVGRGVVGVDGVERERESRRGGRGMLLDGRLSLSLYLAEGSHSNRAISHLKIDLSDLPPALLCHGTLVTTCPIVTPGPLVGPDRRAKAWSLSYCPRESCLHPSPICFPASSPLLSPFLPALSPS